MKLVFQGFLLLMICLMFCGCFALLAGAGGTALWHAGKVISEELVSVDKAVKATERVFKAQKIALVGKVSKGKVVQLRGRDNFDKKIAVDVFSKGANNVRIEIRVGVGEEGLARELLGEIKRKL